MASEGLQEPDPFTFLEKGPPTEAEATFSTNETEGICRQQTFPATPSKGALQAEGRRTFLGKKRGNQNEDF